MPMPAIDDVVAADGVRIAHAGLVVASPAVAGQRLDAGDDLRLQRAYVDVPGRQHRGPAHPEVVRLVDAHVVAYQLLTLSCFAPP